MLVRAKSLKGYALECLDGPAGHVSEFYFDDLHWTVRYLIADTGNWLSGRQVLISPHALGDISDSDKTIKVNLTKKHIEDSPSILAHVPISREFERDYYGYYGWPIYWNGPLMWGPYPFLFNTDTSWDGTVDEKSRVDSHLHSTDDVRGHEVRAYDGDFGYINDFVIDTEVWAMRYIVVDAHKWWPGKKVLIAIKWIGSVDWAISRVFVNLSIDQIKLSPEYTETSLISRDYEDKLHGHYNLQGYWVSTDSQEHLELVKT